MQETTKTSRLEIQKAKEVVSFLQSKINKFHVAHPNA
jgi:hypothetical protein